MKEQQHHDAEGQHQGDDDQAHQTRKKYLRFAAMILTGMAVMYAVMYVASWEWSHVRWSESRLFMTLVMGGTMALVMLGWMRNMYKDTRGNIAVVAAGVLLIVGGVALDRSQVTVQDTAYMSAMIPHHSLAITRSERAELSDIRVCELAVEISEAQRREIDEMDWLIADIEANGEVRTLEEALERPIPEFTVSAARDCALP